MEDEKFIIRTYFKSELAQLYHPKMPAEAAMRKMRRWILLNPRFKAEMEALEFSKADRQYTPRQVEVIIKYLGAP